MSTLRPADSAATTTFLASYQAKEWEPFGHEFSGVVEKVGKLVTNVNVGDTVCIETATFDPLLDCSRNGRP